MNLRRWAPLALCAAMLATVPLGNLSCRGDVNRPAPTPIELTWYVPAAPILPPATTGRGAAWRRAGTMVIAPRGTPERARQLRELHLTDAQLAASIVAARHYQAELDAGRLRY